MATTTVRVTTETHGALSEIASNENKSIQAVLENLVYEYRRRQMFEETNRAYAALRADPVAWAAELEEQALWETTLMDGLEDLDDLEDFK